MDEYWLVFMSNDKQTMNQVLVWTNCVFWKVLETKQTVLTKTWKLIRDVCNWHVADMIVSWLYWIFLDCDNFLTITWITAAIKNRKKYGHDECDWKLKSDQEWRVGKAQESLLQDDPVPENCHYILPQNCHPSGDKIFQTEFMFHQKTFYSFNEDTLKILATDIEQQNGLIPCK